MPPVCRRRLRWLSGDWQVLHKTKAFIRETNMQYKREILSCELRTSSELYCNVTLNRVVTSRKWLEPNMFAPGMLQAYAGIKGKPIRQVSWLLIPLYTLGTGQSIMIPGRPPVGLHGLGYRAHPFKEEFCGAWYIRRLATRRGDPCYSNSWQCRFSRLLMPHTIFPLRSALL